MVTGGDVAPNRARGKGLFGQLTALLRDADLTWFNLENSLARVGQRIKGKPVYLRGDPAMAEGLVEAGVDAVNVANNHVLDFGVEAFFASLDTLNACAIPYFGGGQNLAAARKGMVIERNGLTVGLLGYTTTLPMGFAATKDEPGVASLRVSTTWRIGNNPNEYPGSQPVIVTSADRDDVKAMQANIRRLKRITDIVLVYQHWGTSMTHHVRDFQSEVGHAAIDAGAAAVFGGHQHVLSAIEIYKDCPIVHCSGNLVFDKLVPFFTDETVKSFLFGATLTRRGVENPYLIPVKCGVKVPPRQLNPARGLGREIVNQVTALSEPYGTRYRVDGERVHVLPA